MSQRPDPNGIYLISVRNILDDAWVHALELEPIGTQRHYVGTVRTTLTLQLADQAELLGLLNRLHHMGLAILSVELAVPKPI